MGAVAPWRVRALSAFAIALLALLVGAGAASADWAPVQSEQLNASGFNGLAGGGASVGDVTYFGWAETEDKGSYIHAQHVSKIEDDKIAGELEDPESASKETAAPQPFAVDNALYLVDGASVLKLEGSEWKKEGKALEGAISLAEESSGGKLLAGFVNAGHRVQIDRFSGTSWSPLVEGAAPKSGQQIESMHLLSYGSTPIVSWETTEDLPSGGGVRDRVYADELSGGTLKALAGGAELNEAGEDSEAVSTLATIGGTPYIGIGEARATGESETAYTRVLKLEGDDFDAVGSVVREVTYYYQLRPGLAEYGGDPVAVTIAEDPKLQVLASSFSGGSWGALGGQLGVPPLPAVIGDPYSLVTFEGSESTPYVALQQQVGEEYKDENLYLEAYTAAGVDPLGSGSSSAGPHKPIVTESVIGEKPSGGPPPAPAAASPAPDSAVLELVGSPKLTGRKALKLSSGIELYCPPAERACTGTVTLELGAKKTKRAAARALVGRRTAERAFAAKAKKAKAKAPKLVTAKLTVAAGAHRTIVLVLTGAAAKAIAAARTLDGSLQVSASGGNDVATTLSEKLKLKLKEKSK